MAGVPAVFRTRHLPNINPGRYLYAYFLSKSVEYAQYRTVNVVLYDINRSHECRKVHTLTVFCVLRNYLLLLCLNRYGECTDCPINPKVSISCTFGKANLHYYMWKVPQFTRFLSRNSSHKRMTNAWKAELELRLFITIITLAYV